MFTLAQISLLVILLLFWAVSFGEEVSFYLPRVITTCLSGGYRRGRVKTAVFSLMSRMLLFLFRPSVSFYPCLVVLQTCLVCLKRPVLFPCLGTLQMKGQWESNKNVWFQFMFSQKWNCKASLFLKQNYNGLSPNFHFHVYLLAIYMFSGSVCLFCCGRLILGIYQSLTDTWMKELGTRPRSFISGNT